MIKLAPNWRGLLARVIREEDIKVLRLHEHTGRPLGEKAFLATLEQKLGRILRRQKPGPKRRSPREVWYPRTAAPLWTDRIFFRIFFPKALNDLNQFSAQSSSDACQFSVNCRILIDGI